MHIVATSLHNLFLQVFSRRLALNNAIKLEEMNMITLFPTTTTNNIYNVLTKYENEKKTHYIARELKNFFFHFALFVRRSCVPVHLRERSYCTAPARSIKMFISFRTFLYKRHRDICIPRTDHRVCCCCTTKLN